MFLKCLFYYFKFVGIAPVAINAVATKKKKACDILFVSSRLGILYNSILVCFLVCISYFHTKYAIDNKRNYPSSHLEVVVDVVCVIVTHIASLVILIHISINKKKATTIVNELNTVYQKQKIEFESYVQSILLRRSVKIIVFTTVISMILSIIMALIGDPLNLLYVPITLINYGTILQYTLILKLLYCCYRSINTELQSILRSTVPIFISINNRSLVMDFQRISKKIKRLREIHILLSHLSRDVSDFYALPMLFCMTSLFLALITYCYYITAILLNIRETVAEYAVALVLCTFLMFIDILMMVMLARNAGLTATESKRTGEIVGELITNGPNELALSQLNQFLSYLLQVQVHFSVFNLFDINESLLTSIASSATTYMVVLLQFRSSYDMGYKEDKGNVTKLKIN